MNFRHNITQTELRDKIVKRLEKEAKRAYDPDECVDSDGTDQAASGAYMSAADIVHQEFSKHFVVEPDDGPLSTNEMRSARGI